MSTPTILARILKKTAAGEDGQGIDADSVEGRNLINKYNHEQVKPVADAAMERVGQAVGKIFPDGGPAPAAAAAPKPEVSAAKPGFADQLKTQAGKAGEWLASPTSVPGVSKGVATAGVLGAAGLLAYMLSRKANKPKRRVALA